MPSPNEFLNNLVGQWELTGRMGQVPLRQSVEARWTLGGLFVELYFKSTLPESRPGRPPYEAIYFIGYNAQDDVYVMHLLDTFGVATECVVGLGRREGDTIPFVFHYPSGPFTTRLLWTAAAQAWDFEQTYVQAGQVETFATRHMVRRPATEEARLFTQ